MKRKVTHEQLKALYKENAKYPRDSFVRIEKDKWPPSPQSDISVRIAVYRSRNWLVQVFQQRDSFRLSICRTQLDKNGDWVDNITWDELMEIKRQCGYGDFMAIEFYPPDKDIVNIANMRHLWIPGTGCVLPEHWRKEE